MSNILQYNSFSLLNQILPFIHKYKNSIFVIKYGGSVMQNEFLQNKVIENICFLNYIGIKVVLVHGGGPFINDWLAKLNIKPKFKDGIRVTDMNTMEIVEMVLVGKINKKLVSLFSQNNIDSIGLSGKDSNLISASSLFQDTDNLVGKINNINTELLTCLLNNNYIPVISSIGKGLNNETYNINADTVAGFIAKSLKADKLILLTDTSGILHNINDASTLVKTLNLDYVDQLRKDLVINGGMIPKVECCIEALKAGVNSTHIINGSIENALLYEVFTQDRIGSMIVL